MVLLDRSRLRLKAATAKLKKQPHCNMSRENAQMQSLFAAKRHKMLITGEKNSRQDLQDGSRIYMSILKNLVNPVYCSVYYRGQCQKQKS